MNASYFIEFKRGDQLLTKLPELTGAGLRENAFKVASKEEVAMTKVAIGGRVGNGTPIHDAWVKELANRLKTRRKEFAFYKRNTQPGLDSVTGFSDRLTQFATEL